MIEFKNCLTGTLMAVAPEREAEYLAAGHTRVDAPAAVPARQPAEEPAAKQTAEEPTAKQTAEEPTAKQTAAKQTAAPAPKKKAAARK
jgi:hypothetical protein